MATPEEVRIAIAALLVELDRLDEATRAKIPDRSVSAHLRDLDLVFWSRFDAGRLQPVSEVASAEAPGTDLRLAMSSDELLALLAGEVSFPLAWATGRIRVYAGFGVLLELRRFL